jgi:hypothetical protein
LQDFLSELWGAALPLFTAYSLGVICFRSLPLPAILRLGLGAIVESFLIFVLFLMGCGSPAVFLATGTLCTGLCAITLLLRRPPVLAEVVAVPLDAVSRWVFFPALAIYGVLYLVHAAAPEIQPDAITYHLGLTAEYVRLHGFPDRIGFYEVLPQGMEMLFAAAFAFGRHSAAKLFHFSLLAATVPLIIMIARRLKLPDMAGFSAGIVYVAAPVVGVSGASAYTDAGLVFFHLAAFYLLLVWRDDGRGSYAFAAGLAAGFCFAIKFTGLLAAPLALVFVVAMRRRSRDAFLLSAGAALVIAPWMLRAFILTDNPVAPLFNAWFPNEFFSASAEQTLSRTFRTYSGFQWSRAPWDWGFSGHLQGVAGPLVFLLPFAFLAWRKPAARVVLCAGLLLLTPILYNVGTRFLMPALPFLALALVAGLLEVIPPPAVWGAIWGLVALQAVLCFPPVMSRISAPQSWMLRGFPWRAALRLEPESEYLEANSPDYEVARMVETNTKPRERVFTMATIANAYSTRDLLPYWHSSRAAQLADSLRSAFSNPVMARIQANWPPASLRGLRFVATSDWPGEWRIFDVRVFSPAGVLTPGPEWFLKAWPNIWEAPRAFDGNRATYWSSRAPEGRGMYLEVDFDRPEMVSSIELLSESNKPVETMLIQGLPADGSNWRLLTDGIHTEKAAPQDLRREAVRSLRNARLTYILVGSEGQGTSRIGKDMLEHPIAWGVEDVASIGPVHLFRIL